MSHEIERFTDGSAAFASNRLPAWHHLGTVTGDAMTAAEAITTAKLGGWNVRKIPVAGHTTTGTPSALVEEWIDAPDMAMTVRTNPVTSATDYLGIVGTSYTPVQTGACPELLALPVDASGAHFEPAGSLSGGRRV